MSKFRFVYWLGSIKTEHYVSAKTEDKAVERFKEQKGNKEIVSIELCK